MKAPAPPIRPLTPTRLKYLKETLSGDRSFVYWDALPTLNAPILVEFGSYCELAAAVELHLRRLYFALRAKGANERGPERATFDQLLERLPGAVASCEVELPRRDDFLERLSQLRAALSRRNDVIHSAFKWDPDGDVLVSAHANETVGRGIKTGQDIAYWLIPRTEFVQTVRDLDRLVASLLPFILAWLPVLRPWLKNYNQGQELSGEALSSTLSELEHRHKKREDRPT